MSSRLLIAREIGDRRGEGNALGNLGLAYADLGEVEKAIGYHEQALVISRAIGDRRGEGATLSNLGNAYADLGKVEKARGYLQQALAIGQQIKDPQIIQVCEAGLTDLADEELTIRSIMRRVAAPSDPAKSQPTAARRRRCRSGAGRAWGRRRALKRSDVMALAGMGLEIRKPWTMSQSWFWR